jgi:SulP family sulfate permease
LIGGIGFFIVFTAVQISINAEFDLSLSGFETLFDNYNLFLPVVYFEILLRSLIYLSTNKETGAAKFPLLAPAFYCVTPFLFFLALKIFGMPLQEAQEDGFFFPSVAGNSNQNEENHGVLGYFVDAINDPHLFDIWRVLDLKHISLPVVVKSMPTIIGMTLFSLVHVPLYVPAFSLSTGQDGTSSESI